MSTAHVRFLRVLTLGLIAVGGLAAVTAARADVLDDFKNNKKLAVQKLEAEIDQAVQLVQQIKAKEPRKALNIMEAWKAYLDGDTVLTKERRAELINTVNQQIQVLEKSVAIKGTVSDAPPKKTKSSADDQYDQYSKHTPSQGSYGGKGPSGTAKDLIGANKGSLDKYKDYKTQMDKSTTTVLNSIDLGQIPDSDSGVAFSKDWKSKKELRLRMAGMLLTAEEKSLMKAMNKKISVDFEKQPLRDVIDYLEKVTNQSIVIDPNALKDRDLDYSTPVSFRAKNITFRTALKKVLGDVGLAYILKEGVVQVVTPQVASSTLTTRAYSIADLLPPPMPGGGYFFNAAREQQYANQVMQMIVMTVEPSSWAVNGGKGTIMYNPASRSIVINNSAEMHLNMKASLAGGWGY